MNRYLKYLMQHFIRVDREPEDMHVKYPDRLQLHILNTTKMRRLG